MRARAKDVGTNATTATSGAPSRLLRGKCACGGRCADCDGKTLSVQRSAPAVVDDVLSTPGEGTRALTASHIGHDFSRVPIYSYLDTRADYGHVPAVDNSTKRQAGAREAEVPEQDSERDPDRRPETALETPPEIETPPQPFYETPESPEPLKGGGAQPAVKVVTQTVATTPANRKRTQIGIGEEVVCSTDPGTAAGWAVTGGGAVDTVNGASTKFTASLTPSKPTVTATLGKKVLTVKFDVIAPDAMTSSFGSDSGVGTPGPPNNKIGFETVFDCVVKPDTVSFYRVNFRENIPANKWTWPDGAPDSKGPKIVPWGVGYDNKTTDTVGNSPRPIGRLFDGKKNVNFGYTIKVPEDYQDDSGSWVAWLPNEEHYKEFSGADQKGRGSLIATNKATGGWQGPWQ